MKRKRKLPDKLSDLLDIAVTDCIEVSKLKNYKLNMNIWRTTYIGARGKKMCAVCMAGAVVDRRLAGLYSENWCGPDLDHPAGDDKKLRAIDLMRQGRLIDAADRLGVDRHVPVLWELGALISRRIPPSSGRAPWPTYRRVVKELRKLGL